MSQEPDPGVFVESGTFRVDKSRAVRKLELYQLAEDASPLLLWVRCANACASSLIRIRQQACWCEIRFDGEPFSSSHFHDPFSALFDDEAQAEPRMKHLAFGLIQAVKLAPRLITIRSGAGLDRSMLRITPIEGGQVEQEVSPDVAAEKDTSIQLEWSSWDREASLRAHLQRERCPDIFAMSRASLALEDSLIVDPAEDPPGEKRFEEEGTRVVLSRRGSATVPVGRAGFYSYGVLVSVSEMGRGFGAAAWLNDDRFQLNASLDGVVQDERLRRARTLLRERAAGFLARKNRGA